MIFERADSFVRDYVRLPDQVRAFVEKAIRRLAENPRHPSLSLRKMRGLKDVAEARITRGYRLTFNWQHDVITFRHVGTHDILKREKG